MPRLEMPKTVQRLGIWAELRTGWYSTYAYHYTQGQTIDLSMAMNLYN